MDLEVADDDLADIRERLQWTPAERLDYLLDMLEFERQMAEARAERRD